MLVLLYLTSDLLLLLLLVAGLPTACTSLLPGLLLLGLRELHACIRIHVLGVLVSSLFIYMEIGMVFERDLFHRTGPYIRIHVLGVLVSSLFIYMEIGMVFESDLVHTTGLAS